MAARTVELTDGEVEATTQRDRLLAYMKDYGVTLPDLRADTVERRLEDESLPEHIKELLRVRQQASKASTAKYQRAINQSVGGRLRNLLVFCGAARTGRWAGRTLQPQNLPRPKHPQWEIDLAIRLFRGRAIDLYDADAVFGLASSSLRGLIVAEHGRKLVVSDYANIEGRDMAWVAGEQWKLDAFAAYDRGEGPDLYKVAYGRAFNIDPKELEDNDPRRQIGKVMELALQYYGGVGAFCSMAETYGLSLEELARSAWPVIPGSVKRDAQAAWHKALKRHRSYGLDERTWTVCHALVLMWRAAHPAICNFWAELDQACKMATRVPNKEYPVGRHISVDRKGAWLRIKLPSGRYLNYPAPRSDDYTSSFMGIDPYTKQWRRINTYSGKRAENIIQGIAADHMVDGLLAADAAGYNPVLSVHDEAITEPPDRSGVQRQSIYRDCSSARALGPLACRSPQRALRHTGIGNSMLEETVESRLVNGVEAKGGECLKFVSPGRKGVPDRIVLLNGHVIFVETKAPDGKLKSWQARCHDMLRANGQRIEVLWALQQVDYFLATLNS